MKPAIIKTKIKGRKVAKGRAHQKAKIKQGKGVREEK